MPWALLTSLELCTLHQLRMNLTAEIYTDSEHMDFFILQVRK